MIASPRSLARKPLILGIAIFLLFTGAVVGVLYLMEGRDSARTLALEERVQKLESEWDTEKSASREPSTPLCDASTPDVVDGEGRWLTYLDCLAERHRDPRERLMAVSDGLKAWDSDELRERRWRLLSELGRHDELVRHLRSELDDPGLSASRRNRGELHLLDALTNQDSRRWTERQGEVSELLDSVEPRRCDELATVIYAAHLADAAERVGQALRAYDGRGCATRVHSGELEVLMELVGVGTVASLYTESPESVLEAPKSVATNFTIKSEFAMCAAELPGEAGLRETCENLLRSVEQGSVVTRH